MGVMGAKLGTKAFGQTQTAPVSANAIPNTLSAQDMEKLNGEHTGEVLNKLADPNWVDPSKKIRTVGNDKLDKDAFFKLMLAQMKNQDPTNPMKSHEMAAQLANFSSLEQMQNMNTTLNEMKMGQKPIEQFQALNFIGKSVAGDSSQIIRARGDKSHDLIYNLPQPANDVKIVVKNADGEVVKKYDLKNLKQGENRISWSGEDEKGSKAPEGEYRFFIEAKNSQGLKLDVKTDFNGTITGVSYTPEGPVLQVGSQSVRLKDVRKITDPSLMKNDQKVSTAATPDLKNTEVIKQNESKDSEGAPAAAPKSKILDQVGMSSEMMGKLVKETKN